MSDLRDALEGLRDVLWTSLEQADADKRAGLAREYRATLTQLAELSDDAAPKGTGLDEFNAFKQQREAEAAGRAGKASG